MPRLVIRLRECVDLHAQRTGERLTYADVAKRAKLSSNTVKKISNRKQSYNATLSTLEKLCQALDVNLSDLVEWG
jgi:DNA-binding Xre family transcriptional regulator